MKTNSQWPRALPALLAAAWLGGCAGTPRGQMKPKWSHWITAAQPSTTAQADELILEVGGIV